MSLPRAAWPACRAILGAPAPQEKPSPAETRGPTSPPEPHASPRSLKAPQSHPGGERRDPGSHNRHSTCPSLCVSGWVGRKPAASCPRHGGHRHVLGAAGGGKVGKGARQPRLSGHGRAITSQAWHCCVLSPPQRQGHAGRHRGTLASPHHDPRPPPLCQAVCKCQLPVSTSSRFTPFVFFYFIFFFSAPPPPPSVLSSSWVKNNQVSGKQQLLLRCLPALAPENRSALGSGPSSLLAPSSSPPPTGI